MNRYRLTALEDIEVSVSDEHPATVLVRGLPRRVASHGSPYWKPLHRNEVCEVIAVHGVRGDLFEESIVTLPKGTESMVVHQALLIEALDLRGGSHEPVLPPSETHPIT